MTNFLINSSGNVFFLMNCSNDDEVETDGESLGEHTPAMYEEHAGELHQAQAHRPCWLHLRWSRVLDFAGSAVYSERPEVRLICFRMGPSLSRTLPGRSMSMTFSE